MHGILALIAAGALAPHPARAETIEENEALVMRIVFEDCLGWVRHGRTPFAGLATRPASAAAAADFPAAMPDHDQIVELLSPRYAAAWGANADARHCIVRTVGDGRSRTGPGRLGVRPGGFIARVAARARTLGLTERTPEYEFSPLTIPTWSEPETGHDTGPLRPVRVIVMPMGRSDDGSLEDAGSIVVAGPPLPGR